MKVIQIGLGDFGFGWLKDVLISNKNVEIIGLVDRNLELLNKAQQLTGCSKDILFFDLKDALKKNRPDFILNITPPSIHKTIDLEAINEGIPILSEKPIAEIYSDAVEIFEKSKEVNVPITISENYRYSNTVRKLKEIISSGKIGRMDSIQVHFNRKHKMMNYHKDLEYPLLLDVTIHHIDMVRYLTGVEAETVFARGWAPKWSWYKNNSNLDMLINMQNDIKVTYAGSLSSFSSETDWPGEWRIEGEKGVLKMRAGRIHLYNGDETVETSVEEIYDSRKLVLDEFMECLQSRNKSETDISDNINTFKIVDAAIKSLNTGEIIKL